ncbi:hypothetical protein MIND_01223000 [Mycena indigotica]|uniref:Uncharacterized protein n=1 Tax=Mycena indigotica TaxID=2126181 RepID=A0A8H6S3E8_9AGAR|nr:uncharacterized protein MIND_01223000 [Mycena indigotica]KAF7291973.1 hypothetical protein MIND_01223000 [Mycena indigotica]
MSTDASHPWSRYPPEIKLQITLHNRGDIHTLCAMCLVSKEMRAIAIEQVFRVVSFTYAKDLEFWVDILRHTPTLSAVVRRVRFLPHEIAWFGVPPQAPERDTDETIVEAIPMIPPMPNVVAIDWALSDIRIQNARALLQLCPNATELNFLTTAIDGLPLFTHLLAEFGSRLLSLSLDKVMMLDMDMNDQWEEPGLDDLPRETVNFDLSGVQRLSLVSAELDGTTAIEYIEHLFEMSSPRTLKELHLRSDPDATAIPCSLNVVASLLTQHAPSLVNLTIDPSFADTLTELKNELPLFPLLKTLTVWLETGLSAELFINRLNAPNLSWLFIRLDLWRGDWESGNETNLAGSIDASLPWGRLFPSIPFTRTALRARFPTLGEQSIVFQICAGRDADLHYSFLARDDARLQFVTGLMAAGSGDLAGMRVEWLDPETGYGVIEYDPITGRAPWPRPPERSDRGSLSGEESG